MESYFQKLDRTYVLSRQLPVFINFCSLYDTTTEKRSSYSLHKWRLKYLRSTTAGDLEKSLSVCLLKQKKTNSHLLN